MGQPALITPSVLRWARLRINMPLEKAAKRLKVETERLEAWERGDELPTLAKAKEIAQMYRRPLAIFYLPEPPEALEMLHDFRRLPSTEQVSPSTALMLEIERAEYLRSVALQLLTPDEAEFKYLHTVSIDDNAERVATYLRQILGITLEQQYAWKGEKYTALRAWIEAVERLHVLVLQSSHTPGEGFELEEARGFSIGESFLPVILINAKDGTAGRIFTLLHEFTHLLLNATGICDLREVWRPTTEEQRIEAFCNRVAGASLIPAAALAAQPVVQKHNPQDDWTDEEIAKLARTFTASDEAVVRRLVITGRANEAFYRRKHEEYRKFYAELRSQPKEGRAPHERMVLRKNGVAFTRLVLEAYYSERISLNKAASYLGINLKHLAKVEAVAFAGTSIE